MIGIYAITNTQTGQMYIGRSVQVEKRLYGHFRTLRLGTHDNPYLQNSYTKYGAEAFAHRTLIVCTRDDLPFYERLLIAGYRSDNPKLGFNLTIAIEDRLTHTPEARAAISAFQTVYQNANKYERTEEIRAKISKSLTGRVGVNKGRVFGDEFRAKIGAAKKGNTNRLGKTHSAETKAKIAASVNARYATDPSIRAAQSAAKKGKPSPRKGISLSPEARAKLLAPNPGQLSPEEIRKKLSAAERRQDLNARQARIVRQPDLFESED